MCIRDSLQVSRNTIEQAYAQLLSEGYILSKEKSGYYVAAISTLAKLKPTVSHKTEPTQHAKQSYPYDFSPFSIDLTHFPYQTWRKLSKDCLNSTNSLFLLGENQGDYPFRESIAHYLHHSRRVNLQPEQIVVGAGVDYLLGLIGGLFSKDTKIAMEDPTYMRAYRIFHGLGFETKPIPVDNHGINIEQLRASNATIAYVTPSHQYPLGVVMPISRRQELLNWASEKNDRYIIEDDHDSEFRYKGKPIPSLQGLIEQDNVIYIGTFSRAIAPAIRIGYMVLPVPLLEKFKKTMFYYSCSVSRIDQAILTDFINQGYFERHVNRMRKIYKSKHDCMIQAFHQFGQSVKIQGEYAGLHLVVTFQTNANETEIMTEAKKEGIQLYPLSEHYVQKQNHCKPSFLFGFANLSEEIIQTGISKLYGLFIRQGWI